MRFKNWIVALSVMMSVFSASAQNNSETQTIQSPSVTTETLEDNTKQLDVISEGNKDTVKDVVLEDFPITEGTVASEKMRLIDDMIKLGYFFVEQRVELKNNFISKEDNLKVVSGVVLPSGSGQEAIKNTVSVAKSDIPSQEESSNIYTILFWIAGVFIVLSLWYIFFKNWINSAISFLVGFFNKAVACLILQVVVFGLAMMLGLNKSLVAEWNVYIVYAMLTVMIGVIFGLRLWSEAGENANLVSKIVEHICIAFGILFPLIISLQFNNWWLYFISIGLIAMDIERSVLKKFYDWKLAATGLSYGVLIAVLGAVFWGMSIALSYNSTNEHIVEMIKGISIIGALFILSYTVFKDYQIQWILLNFAVLLISIAFVNNPQIQYSAYVLLVCSFGFFGFIIFKEAENKMVALLIVGLSLLAFGLLFKWLFTNGYLIS